MTRRDGSQFEQAIDIMAATAFALCAGWSFTQWGLAPMGAGGAAALSGVLASGVLRRVGGVGSGIGFQPAPAEFDEPVDDTLLLEDRLVEPAADSQVVRLFAVGGGRGPNVPGALAERIDEFLGHGRGALRMVPAQPDATQELYDALAEIRRSLR